MTQPVLHPTKSDHHLFDLELQWNGMHPSSISTTYRDKPVQISSPVAFGGPGTEWSPEHLFVGSIGSCLLLTLLDVARKMKFEPADIRCSVIGHLQLVEGRYRFTTIDLYPKIFLKAEADREAAEKALAKAQKYCLIANSINGQLFYHSEIVMSEQGVSAN